MLQFRQGWPARVFALQRRSAGTLESFTPHPFRWPVPAQLFGVGGVANRARRTGTKRHLASEISTLRIYAVVGQVDHSGSSFRP